MKYKVSLLDKHNCIAIDLFRHNNSLKNVMCAKQSFVSACRSALSGHSYYRTHKQDIHISIAHIEDSGQTCASVI